MIKFAILKIRIRNEKEARAVEDELDKYHPAYYNLRTTMMSYDNLYLHICLFGNCALYARWTIGYDDSRATEPRNLRKLLIKCFSTICKK